MHLSFGEPGLVSTRTERALGLQTCPASGPELRGVVFYMGEDSEHGLCWLCPGAQVWERPEFHYVAPMEFSNL